MKYVYSEETNNWLFIRASEYKKRKQEDKLKAYNEYLDCLNEAYFYAKKLITSFEIKLGCVGLDKKDLDSLVYEYKYLSTIAFHIKENREQALREVRKSNYEKMDVEELKAWKK